MKLCSSCLSGSCKKYENGIQVAVCKGRVSDTFIDRQCDCNERPEYKGFEGWQSS